MSQNTFSFHLDPDLEGKINAIYSRIMEDTSSGKKSLSEDWLQLADVAEILGVSTKTVRRHLNNAGLVGKKLGRKLYFHREQVETLLGK